MRTLFFLCCLSVLFLTYSMQAASVHTLTSPYSVDTAVHKVREFLTKHKIQVFALFDHQKEAAKIGLNLAPTQVLVFGNPAVGTLFMQENPQIALELPLKIAIWQNKTGQTQISYTPIDTLAQHYRLQNKTALEKTNALLHKIISIATNQP